LTKSTDNPARREERSPFTKEEREGAFLPLELARKQRNTNKFKTKEENK